MYTRTYAAARIVQGYTQYRSDKAKANQVNRDAVSKAERLREEAIYTDSAFIRKRSYRPTNVFTKTKNS